MVKTYVIPTQNKRLKAQAQQKRQADILKVAVKHRDAQGWGETPVTISSNVYLQACDPESVFIGDTKLINVAQVWIGKPVQSKEPVPSP